MSLSIANRHTRTVSQSPFLCCRLLHGSLEVDARSPPGTGCRTVFDTPHASTMGLCCLIRKKGMSCCFGFCISVKLLFPAAPVSRRSSRDSLLRAVRQRCSIFASEG